MVSFSPDSEVFASLAPASVTATGAVSAALPDTAAAGASDETGEAERLEGSDEAAGGSLATGVSTETGADSAASGARATAVAAPRPSAGAAAEAEREILSPPDAFGSSRVEGCRFGSFSGDMRCGLRTSCWPWLPRAQPRPLHP